MKRKSSLAFGILAIAFLFLFTPAYIDFQDLIDADFLPSGENYEDPDIEDISTDGQETLIVDSGPFFCPLESILFSPIKGVPFQIPSSYKNSFTLRC